VVTVLLLGGWLAVEVVLSTELCEFAVEPLVEEVELELEPPFDELGLLVLATRFGGLFIALLAVIPCGREALTALLLDGSSRGVPASTTFGTALSLAALLLATFTGDELFDAVTLEVGDADRAVFSEEVVV